MTNKIRPAPATLNILSDIPPPDAGEVFEILLKGDGVRVERIVSQGHASPDGFWYNQYEAEWVLILSGRARLAIEGETRARELGPGDSLFLPAHCRHRVTWTEPGAPTIWLAIFLDPRRSPRPAA